MVQSLADTELHEQTQRLLHGRLKHVATAALIAALVPLGSVAMSPAVARADSSGGPPPSCDVQGGHEITVNFNALDGHTWVTRPGRG